jgi:hypothetical protein
MNPKELDPKKLEALRREIEIGLDDEARGEVFDGKEVIAELRESMRKHLEELPAQTPLDGEARETHE